MTSLRTWLLTSFWVLLKKDVTNCAVDRLDVFKMIVTNH